MPSTLTERMLADDLIVTEEALRTYRALALVAIGEISERDKAIRQLERRNRALVDEIRRYTAARVLEPTN